MSLPSAATIIRRGFRWVIPTQGDEIVRLCCVYCKWERGFTVVHGGGVIDEITNGHALECRVARLQGAVDRWRDAGDR